ncbi:MFS general substrate transporter [Hypoxylon sp. NC1633]|nr:MFS general substrate transporter [Hypoxylon sp. NC1633]
MGREINEEAEASLSSGNDLEARSIGSTARDGHRAERNRVEEEPGPPTKAPHVRWRDLPNKDQLFILSLCRLSEPLSNVCLLPYIFYLVRSVLPPATSSSPSNNLSSPDPPPSEAGDATTAARISEFSGLLVAAFPLAQFAVSLPWGRLSDKHGRRLSIVGGLAVSVLANVGFGFSRSLGALLFWRVVAGLANGNVGIMRTVTAEAVREPRFQTKAFLLLPLVFNAGTAASLALGGGLAEPVANLPALFGPGGWLNTGGDPEGVPWARAYPYALPALLNAAILGVSLVLAVAGLRETLPGKEDQDDIGLRAGVAAMRWVRRLSPTFRRARPRRQEYVRIDLDTTDTDMAIDSSEDTFIGQSQSPVQPHAEKPKPPQRGTAPSLPFRRIWTPRVVAALVSFGLLPLHNATFMHVFPVYLSTPAADNSGATALAFGGGLGLRAPAIGLALAAVGIGGILLQLFVYPWMQARIGTRGVLRVALGLFPVAYAVAPYLSLLSDYGNGNGNGDGEGEGDGNGMGEGGGNGNEGRRWALLAAVVCGQVAARTMAIPSTVILLTEAAPARSVLGTVHGAGNMLASLARAVGPAVGGYVFALGVEVGVVGLVWWVYLVAIALGALAWSYVSEG